LERVDKYFHVTEIEYWGETPSLWNTCKTKLHKGGGMIAGTNKTTIFTYRGGWQCNHQIIPVSEKIVPKDVIKRNSNTVKELPIIKELPKSNKIKIEGFKGEHTYGTLSGDKLKIQKDIESKLNLKVPDKLLENIPNDLNIRYSKVDAYFNDSTNTICLDTDSKTKIKNLTHEFGHLNHYKLNQIFTENGVRKYSDEFKELYKEFSNELKELGISNIDKISRNRKDVDIIERMPVLDCLGEASNGNYGGGHTKKYYKTMQRGVEFFAHISENYFVGNDFFKEVLPNTYKLGNAYMKNILKD
jgi:hypothetical protein